MKLRSIRQPTIVEPGRKYDLIIVASGYESRARFVAQKLSDEGITIDYKVAIAFREHPLDGARPDNDAAFAALGFQFLPCSGSSTTEVKKCFESALLPVKDAEVVRMLIDISCMTRAWYGEMVHSLMSISSVGGAEVDFVYTAAEFIVPSEEYPPNRMAGPVPGFFGITLPDKPTALGYRFASANPVNSVGAYLYGAGKKEFKRADGKFSLMK